MRIRIGTPSLGGRLDLCEPDLCGELRLVINDAILADLSHVVEHPEFTKQDIQLAPGRWKYPTVGQCEVLGVGAGDLDEERRDVGTRGDLVRCGRCLRSGNAPKNPAIQRTTTSAPAWLNPGASIRQSSASWRVTQSKSIASTWAKKSVTNSVLLIVGVLRE